MFYDSIVNNNILAVLVVFQDVREDAPKPKDNSIMGNKVTRQRPVQLTAVNKTWSIMAALFGHVWKMPKSVRDNYRGMIAVEDANSASYIPENGPENWSNK